jgi:hypothetical protein
MKNKRLIIVFLLLVVLATAYAVYNTLLNGNSNTANDNKHKIIFDISGCFACYGCSCEYTVDDNEIYILNEIDKTKCIYNLDNGTSGKYHNLINEKLSGDTNSTDIYLEGEDFNKFIECVRNYSR